MALTCPKNQHCIGNNIKDFIINMALRIESRLEGKGQLTPDIGVMLKAITFTISAQQQKDMSRNMAEAKADLERFGI